MSVMPCPVCSGEPNHASKRPSRVFHPPTHPCMVGFWPVYERGK